MINLFEREHVMIFVAFSAVKCAKFAVNVANIRVIDVAIDDIGHDLAAASVVAFRFGQIAPRICQRAQFLQRKAIKLQRFIRRNPFAREDFFCQPISI